MNVRLSNKTFQRTKAASFVLLCAISLGSLSADEVKTSAAGKEIVPSAPSSISELLESVNPWIASLKVERSEDAEGPPINERLLPGEARDYYKRPNAPATGLLVDPRGYVLTSYYNVLGKVTKIDVKLADGKVRQAKLIATSKMDDLAMLRVEPAIPEAEQKSWKPLPWSEDKLQAGKMLFAVGLSPALTGGRQAGKQAGKQASISKTRTMSSPALTITQGIVSAAGRNGRRSFQTDAKLNYGNAGGPMIGIDGRIVGVACFVGHTYPQWGLNSGVGFGSSAKTIREILPRLLEGKHIRPPKVPFLGVVSAQEDLNVRGAKISDVVPESSAGKAGVREGDTIIEIEGREIVSFRALRRLLFDYKVGDTLKMVVERDGKNVELKLTLGERPRDI